MSSRRQLEYESKALRAISVYAERSNKGEKYVYPELAAALRLVVDIGGGTTDCSMLLMGPQWRQRADRENSLLG
ncbi:hypothetical protein ACH57_07375, partial [Salmonella enterica subsp. enterica serovar Typhimurium]